jgi:ABC-2 type transport system ATP-binding protein
MLNGQLSRGYRQRVGLADALLGSPPLLILDEPTAGLDPNQVGQVRSLLRSLAGQQTVLLSTHMLSEAEATCTRAIVVARGRLVADGPIDELRRLGGAGAGLRLVVRGEPAEVHPLLTAAVGSGRVSRAKAEAKAGDEAAAVHEWLVELAPGEPDARADRASSVAELLASRITAAGFGLQRLEPVRTSLEQIFADLTLGVEQAAAPAPGPAASPDSDDSPMAKSPSDANAPEGERP